MFDGTPLAGSRQFDAIGVWQSLAGGPQRQLGHQTAEPLRLWL
jgi:hypothetical protein